MGLTTLLLVATLEAKTPANPCQKVCAKSVTICEKKGYSSKDCFAAIGRCEKCENPK